MIKLQEDSNLYRGIFWILDVDNIDSSNLYFQIPCNSEGVVDSDFHGLQLTEVVS